jgi:hypothetical protein
MVIGRGRRREHLIYENKREGVRKSLDFYPYFFPRAFFHVLFFPYIFFLYFLLSSSPQMLARGVLYAVRIL